MKNLPISLKKMATAICFIAAIICSITTPVASFAKTKKDKPAKAVAASPKPPVEQAPADIYSQEANQLVQRLIADRMVDESKGFVVEKKLNMLFINGQQQTNEIAGKYLQNLTQSEIKVQVYSFRDRLQMHPDAGIMDLIMPVMFKSGCVDTKPAKPGC